MELRFRSGGYACAAVLAAHFGPSLAYASPGPGHPQDDANAIIVTAEKRHTALQDTPVAVSIVRADQIERSHVRDIIDLQTLVPSLKVRQFQNAGQTNFQIRGFGNDANNIGIETAVGVFIDGVYHSRAASALADLPDIEHVEVLRGPQSTLFGKNVSAGAISIVTRRPQLSTTSGMAELTIGNFAAFEGKASINAPLGETAALRVSGSLRERDGYFRSPVAGGRINDRHRHALRLDLLFEPSPTVRFRFLADQDRIAEACCGVVLIFNGPVTTQVIAGLLRAPIGDPGRIYDYMLASDENPTNRLVGNGASLQGEIDLGFALLTSITALRRQTNDYSLDADFTGASIVRQIVASRITSVSQELRLASRDGGSLRWFVGAFLLDEQLRSDGSSTWGRDGRGFLDGITGNAVSTLERLLLATATPGISAGHLIAPGQGLSESYRLSDRSFSLFGNLEHDFGSATISGGIAYVNDRKRARMNNVSSDVFAGLNLANLPQLALLGLPANSFRSLAAVQFFPAAVNFPNAAETGILHGDRITYFVRASYRFSSEVSVYANRSTGWKAGAFNLSRDSRPPDGFGIGRTAQPENITLHELGLKASLARGFLNLALFDQTVEGFQTNSFTGTGFALVNAGKQSLRGLELESGYRPLPGLALGLNLTFLDPKFDSFTRAPCVPADLARCGGGQLYRDLSGTRPADTPAWTINANASYDFEIGGGWRSSVNAEYFHASRTFQALTVPAALAKVEANTVNLAASIGHEDALSLQIWVRNLTSDRYTRNAFPAVGQAGSYVAFPVEPRTYGATLRHSF